MTTAATPGKNPNATNDSRIPEIPVTIEAIDKPCAGPAGTGVNGAWPGVGVLSYPATGVPLGAEYGSVDAAGTAAGAAGGTGGAAGAAGAAGVAAAFAAEVFAAAGFAAAVFAVAGFTASVFAAVGFFAAGFLAAGFLADGVACAFGSFDAEGASGMGMEGVEPSVLLVAIGTL
jgi:hypothetical protein